MSYKFRGKMLRCVGVAMDDCPTNEATTGKNIRCPDCKRRWRLLQRRHGPPADPDMPSESPFLVYDLMAREMGNAAPLRHIEMSEGDDD